MIVSITHCGRCGYNHPDLFFQEFTQPNDIYDRWAMCPESGEPILLMIAADTNGNVDTVGELRRRVDLLEKGTSNECPTH